MANTSEVSSSHARWGYLEGGGEGGREGGREGGKTCKQ